MMQLVVMGVPGMSISVFNFRRIQMTEQSVERQRKNILQKCLIFTQRAKELELEDTCVLDQWWFSSQTFSSRFAVYSASNESL